MTRTPRARRTLTDPVLIAIETVLRSRDALTLALYGTRCPLCRDRVLHLATHYSIDHLGDHQ